MAVFPESFKAAFHIKLQPGDYPVLIVIRRGKIWGVAMDQELSAQERVAAWEAIDEYRRTTEPSN